MVAHEVRNALVPVRVTLDAMYRETRLRNDGDLVDRYGADVDAGIDRVFVFIDEMLQTATLPGEPPEPFDALAALRDALSAAVAELGREVALDAPTSLPEVVGHRPHFVLAVVNLLRNAAQASGGQGNVQLSARLRDQGGQLIITIEDNGPGVPASERATIFRAGYSLRPGGRGHGLAVVREVIETEMQGRVSCDDSPLGGARMTVLLPLAERR